MASAVDSAIGAAIKELRTDCGMSQAELAARASVHITVISSVERGRYHPRWRTIAALIEALGITYTELGRAIDAQRK